MRIDRILICIVSAFLLCNLLSSQIGVNFTACIDNTIYEESNSLSNGNGDYILVGKAGPVNGNYLRRGLIMTDFDLIPSSAIIVSAKLVIIGASGSPQILSLHRALKQWGEGLSDAPGNESGGAMATSHDATWNQSKFGSIFWSSLGGDFAPIPTASALIKPSVSNEFSGPDLTADVQAWVDGSLSNYGWMIIGNETTSGSAIGLNSGDINNGIPYINVKYKLPARQILINEVHPTDKWIELSNPGPNTIDIGDWYLCNNANCDKISAADVTFLQGNSVIPSKGYVRIAWDDISMTNGEIALMKSSSTSFFEVMEDYMQYGGPNQSRSYIAVKAGVWNDMSSTVTTPNTLSSLGIDGNSYANGEDSNQTSWQQQVPTPNQQNICSEYLNLTSSINLGIYAAKRIDYNGTSQTGSGVGLNYGNFVEFKPNSTVSNGTILHAQKRECSN
ncbi:MAG: hypothetical protein ACJA01_001673 [Saprospiraceae bacterium]|jgi:hypothetical protein